MKSVNLLKTIAICSSALLTSNAWSANEIWTDVGQKLNLAHVDKVNVNANRYRLLNAEFSTLKQLLLNRTTNSYQLELPMPDGSMATFQLEYAPVYDIELEMKYPSIRTFKGYQVDNPTNRGRFDITPHGFHGMFTFNNQRAFIDPMQRGNTSSYLSYYKNNASPMSKMITDEVLQIADGFVPESRPATPQNRAGETLKTYRIAMAATGEYTAFHGGTKELGQAAIVTTMNRVNEVYNVDLSVQLTLVANNDTVVYTDASTDPYANDDTDINTNGTVLDEKIGSANYDIGHVVSTGAGGLAGLGVVCGSQKAAGITGTVSPVNDAFSIDYVAHEIGHQFGGEHSFNGNAGSCGTRSANDAYEPGSGSTIMAYAGICDAENLQQNSDAFFHSHSVEQMGAFIQTATCSTTSALNNEAPTVSAGSDYTIPASTPVLLTGSATDPDSDTMSYSWEQFDLGTVSTSPETMVDDGSRPIFRAFLPTSSPTRYLPKLSDILAGTSTIGESYATTSRTMTFKLMARDNKGNTASDTMVITVDSNSGPFTVTAPASGDTWTHSTNPVVTWNTANTDQSPVSCSTVDIMLSTDGGTTFAHTVLSGTPNDGSQAVNVPALDSTTARLQVKCANNIFFAVNNGAFTVNGVNPNSSAPVITGQTALSVNEDSSLTIALTDLTVTDADSSYPGDFTLSLSSGDNYTVSGATITPTQDFNGTLTVPVKVNDGTSDSNSFDLTVTVNAVNDAPVISAAQTLSTNEDEALTLSISNITVTDVDNTADQLSMSIVAGDNYSVDGLSVTPATNFNGALSVSVKVNDGQADSNSFAITVNVAAVNDAPVITGPATMTMTANGSLTLTASMLEITDVDNSTSDMTLTVSSGENYTVSGSTITPTTDFTGTLSVAVKVNDGAADSNTFTVSVTVSADPTPTLISQLSFNDSNFAACITATATANGWTLIEQVVSLSCTNKLISDITGVEHFAARLTSLDLTQNIIVDIASLSSMSALTSLKLTNNKVRAISPLFDLTQIEKVNLLGNDHINCTDLDALGTSLTKAQITKPKHCDGSGLAITDVQFKSDKLRQCVIDTATSKGWSTVDEVTELSCGSTFIDDLSGLNYFIHLTSLTLNDNQIRDLTPLQSLIELTTLDLRKNAIINISDLARLTELVSIKLTKNSISDISVIAGFSKLEQLSMADNQVGDANLSSLTNLKSLTVLYLRDNLITDISALATMTQMTQLYLSRNTISDVSKLAELTNLTKLELDDNKISDVIALMNLANATYIKLVGNDDIPCGDVDNLAATLSNATVVKPATCIHIADISFADTALAACVTEARTQNSWVTANQVDNLACVEKGVKSLDGLDNLTALETLDLRRNEIVNIKPLRSLIRLKTLKLAKNKVAEISSVALLTRMTFLSISENAFDQTTLNALAQLKALDTLYLRNNQLTDITALGQMRSITKLYLSNNQIVDISKLARLKSLQTLHLENNAIEKIDSLFELDQATNIKLSGNDSINCVELDRLASAVDGRVLTRPDTCADGTPPPLIYLADNNVTIKARAIAEVGYTAVINDKEYVVVDKAKLVEMIANGEDVTKVVTSKIKDMSWMFYYSTFNQAIGTWDTSNVTDMTGMFFIGSFDQDISEWDTSKVTSMSSMFFFSAFNQDIGNWDTSKVTDMRSMFRNAGNFNQNLNRWDVKNVSKYDSYDLDADVWESRYKPIFNSQ